MGGWFERPLVQHSVPTKIMLNNVKVKNESACAQQKRWFAEKKSA